MMPARTPVPSMPVGDVGDHLIGNLIGFPPVQVRLVVRLAVPPAAEDDLDPGALGEVFDGERVLGQPAVGLVDERDATRLLVALQLDQRELGVIEDVVADPGIAHQVQEQVLVNQGEAELVGRDRAADGHDGRWRWHMPEHVYTIGQWSVKPHDGHAHPPGPRAGAAPRYRRRVTRGDHRRPPRARRTVLEINLARQFGVSRQPVREAIRTLEREGLLTSQPNRGTFVTRVSLEDAIAIQDIRAELEGLAARLAVANLAEADFKHLRDIVKQMRDAGRRQEPHKLVALDLEFHDVINTNARHRLLLEVLASVAVYTRGFIVHTKSYYARQVDLQFVANSHALLLEELLTRDPARAEQAVHAHIQSALASLTTAAVTDGRARAPASRR